MSTRIRTSNEAVDRRTATVASRRVHQIVAQAGCATLATSNAKFHVTPKLCFRQTILSGVVFTTSPVMAPTRVKTGSSKGSNKRSSKPSTRGSTFQTKNRSSTHQAASASKQKNTHKPTPSGFAAKAKKKRREYTEKELDIPKLNMITPAGVGKPRGKKKGKVFVDDQESMMTILAMVNADKEGQIESKMMKARQMEEIRQARQREMEARAEGKKQKLNETKESLRKGRRKGAKSADSETKEEPALQQKVQKKKVSFG